MEKNVPRKATRRKAGHRSWAARSAKVAGGYRGDIMSPATRSIVMSRIKGSNTGPERILFAELRRQHVYFAKHVSQLPGRPDIVFRKAMLAIFIDGDFWHGWRFPLWQHKLSPKWRKKIAMTRDRDKRNFRRLRRLGYKVVRIWEHQIESHSEDCVSRILAVRSERLSRHTKKCAQLASTSGPLFFRS
ncbi:MAG: very short patch repair endonuclease [Blastocatellia bacterium]